MEAEVVRMCINMFNGDENCCGTVLNLNIVSIIEFVPAFCSDDIYANYHKIIEDRCDN